VSAVPPACPHHADVPWRAARVPAGAGKVAHVIFGIQAASAEGAAPHRAQLARLFAADHGPGTVESARYTDPQGWHCEVLLAYWLDAADYAAWSALPEVRGWWRELPTDAAASVGFWREAMVAPLTRFQYGAGSDHLAGLVTLTGVEPSTKFGYWGGYRDRIPDSVTDKFLSPLTEVPEPVLRATRGRRLRVTTPDNLCYLREGQGWNEAGSEERAIWQAQMEPTVADWTATLRDEPRRTGCLSVRCCREHEVASGEPLERQFQAVFALSLHHVERAARTTPTHLAVKDTFTRMHAEAQFEPRMHVWVEMLILKAGDLVADYVNCHPHTGLLPYFEPLEGG